MLYGKYGKKVCRKKGSEAAQDTEGIDDTSLDDALGEEEHSSDEQYVGEEGGEYGYNEGEDGGEGVEGEEDGSAVEGEELAGEEKESLGEDESLPEEPKSEEVKRKRTIINKVMEYDIKDMYPEMSVLVNKKKKEWDYQDPDIIRALWLESKTHVLAEWKVRNAKIKTGKPSLEVRDNVTYTLRQEHLQNQAELKKALEEREFETGEIGREAPHFDSMQLVTNLTTEMRYKYNRNNPPVPSHYVEHFEKYKKPPFKLIPNTLSCKL